MVRTVRPGTPSRAGIRPARASCRMTISERVSVSGTSSAASSRSAVITGFTWGWKLVVSGGYVRTTTSPPKPLLLLRTASTARSP